MIFLFNLYAHISARRLKNIYVFGTANTYLRVLCFKNGFQKEMPLFRKLIPG